MTSSRPYLIRALYEWIVENDCTPYILINAYEDGVEVPQEHVKDGQIILNISPVAVQDIYLGNDCVGFEGRFAGILKKVLVPMPAILGIYARENGQGMIFDPEQTPPETPTPGGRDKTPALRKPGPVSGIRNKPAGKKSPLRLVK
ncbi:MAG: ClpXP protease specificity-enhancing factor [Gammaproteobacteria bacterium]|nr:ClpXP protease specificity-enhancing factor [Gammaproteobacteria bacterium]MCY4358693.1 ClpXP protease specificity-enhancing factor [Gammaproteobacteria bacterium]